MATLRKDGRWMARAVKDGKRAAFYGKTPEEAERLKAEYLNPPTRSTPEVLTVHDLAGFVWWPKVLDTCRPHTRRKYWSDYTTHVRDQIGSVPVKDLKTSHCQAVIAKMSGKSWKTRHNVKTLMVTVMNCAVDDRMITDNPASRVKLERRPEKRKRFMPASKALEVLQAVKGTHHEAGVTIAMLLGIREAEIAALTWDRLDTVKKTLTVDRQSIKDVGRPVEDGPTKNGRSRTIHLDDTVIDLILAVGDQDSKWIVTAEGRRLLPATLSRRWRDVRDGLGLSTWTFHDLRHAALSLLQAIGAHPFTIMGILGHSKIDTTLLYEAESEGLQRQAMADLSKLLSHTPSTDGVKCGVNDENDQVRLNLARSRGLDPHTPD